MTIESQRKKYSDAFISSVVSAWEGQLGRILTREDDREEHLAPAGSLIGAILTMTGTVQGFAVYYFDVSTASRAADKMGSHPIIPGGLVAMGAVDELVRSIANKATISMQNNRETVEVRVGKIFTCATSGLSGDEEWTGHSYFHTSTDERKIYGVDEAWVFVDLVADHTSSSDMARKTNAIIKAAENGEGPSPANGVPQLPAIGDDAPEKFETLKASEIMTRRIFIVDSSGRHRAALSNWDDGSTNVILTDSEGRMRAAMAITTQGVARIMFVDRDGHREFAAPPQIKRPQKTGRKGTRLVRRPPKSARAA